ncbi:MAG: TRAP transporter small permease subunit [Rhodospirillales bacterium]|nr:TRAP transporter small permease subunit [Rhodospirillales bacterium]
MRALLAISDALDAVTDFVGRMAAWLFIPMGLIIFYDVIQRKLLSIYPDFQQTALYSFLPSTKAQELEWHLHGALFMLCLGFTYIRNGHVRVEVLRERFGRRTRAWIEVLGCLLFVLPYTVFVVDLSATLLVWKSFLINEGSSATTGLPMRWIIKSSLVFGFGFLAIAAFSILLRNIVFLSGPEDLRARSDRFVRGEGAEDMQQEVEEELAQDAVRHPEHRYLDGDTDNVGRR